MPWRDWASVVGLYSKYVLPQIAHAACSSRPTMRQREKVVPLARGRVLEVGVGSGLNFPFYDPSSANMGRHPTHGFAGGRTG